MKKSTSLLFLCVLCAAQITCGRHPLDAEELERNRLFAEILKREDKRILGEDDFLKNNLLGSPYPEVREWCAIALGRIGLPRALPWLYDAFHSPYSAVRAAAAFAVGEIEDREMLKEQFRRVDPRAATELAGLLDDPALPVRMRAVEALGKIGLPSDATEIVKRLEKFDGVLSRHQQAYVSLAITALMRMQNPIAFPVLERLAGEADPEIQWKVANTLYRVRAVNACGTLLRLLQSPDPDVKAHAARGLGICQDPSLALQLHPLLLPRNPVTEKRLPLSVRAYAVQALGSLKNPASVPAIETALRAEPLTASNPDQLNFAVQAAAALGNIGVASAEPVLTPLLKVRGPVANSAIVSLARLLKGASERFFALADTSQFSTPAGTRAWVHALGELGGVHALEQLKQILIASTSDNPEPSTVLAVPSVLESLHKAEAPDLAKILPPYLASRDGVMLRSAIRVYQPRPDVPTRCAPLIQAYGSLAGATDLEAKVAVVNALESWLQEPQVQATLRSALDDPQRNVRIAAARLLAKAGHVDLPAEPGPSESRITDATYQIVANSREDRKVAVLDTTRGRIEIELYTQDAPLTVSNFSSLAARGFYDGLTFMRVVPYFVIQGGDPRNDMEGGPGYTIRCEINMRPFERGSVGMALSGKDTGGSQFFITLSPQPHLDGAYTCFGRVIGGMPVVERMVAGDRIIKAWVEQDTTMLDYRRF